MMTDIFLVVYSVSDDTSSTAYNSFYSSSITYLRLIYSSCLNLQLKKQKTLKSKCLLQEVWVDYYSKYDGIIFLTPQRCTRPIFFLSFQNQIKLVKETFFKPNQVSLTLFFRNLKKS